MDDLMLLQNIAVDIAEDTANLIATKRAELGDLSEYTKTKSSSVDPVTIVDTLAEEFIADAIEKRRPEDGMIGEEGNDRTALSEVTWIVDPIDGTVNFLYGIPHYGVSIAAVVNGEVVASAVANVSTGEIFYAAKGAGAYRRDGKQLQQLRVTSAHQLHLTMMGTGFSYATSRRAVQAALLSSVLPQVRDVRRLGSAALDLCAIAAGQLDAYYEHGLNCWDFAAGMLIAAESGARVWAPRLSTPGEAGEIIIAAAPGVADQVYAMIEQVGGMSPMPHR